MNYSAASYGVSVTKKKSTEASFEVLNPDLIIKKLISIVVGIFIINLFK
jgi:hypothetical protein